MVKPFSCGKQQMKEGLWTDEDDAKTLAYVPRHGAGNWTAMPKKTGFRRCGKNCRIRWNNQGPDLVHNGFSPEEEEMIIKLHATIGSRWAIIAQQLPGRTDNDVKNLWNTKLKKKLSATGIDPVTHRPFSQILADYGNISGFPKARTRFGCLSRDIKNAIMLKSEQSCSPQERSSNFKSYFTTRMNSPTAVETLKDRFLSNSNNSAANDPSLHLLSQLQAIKMVTEASNYTTPGTISTQIPTECISSSASSSSPESPVSATNKTISSPNFSWCDFLLEDAFLPTNAQEQETRVKLSLVDVNTKGKQNPEEKQNDTSIKTIEGSSLPNVSFVEGIIERENEMLSDFNGLLEEPFYY